MAKLNLAGMEFLRNMGANGALILLGLMLAGGNGVRQNSLVHLLGLGEKTVRKTLLLLSGMGLVTHKDGWSLTPRAWVFLAELQQGQEQPGEEGNTPIPGSPARDCQALAEGIDGLARSESPDPTLLVACSLVGIREPLRSTIASAPGVTLADLFQAFLDERVQAGKDGHPARVGTRLLSRSDQGMASGEPGQEERVTVS